MMKGLFISLEGPEGSGKSTHAKRLIKRLEDEGREVIAVREPGGTATGEAIRNILQHDSTGEEIHPETETLLFAASRAQMVHSVIKPALTAGKCVVSDRFIDTTIAYQGYGRGFGVKTVANINEFAVCGTMPDLTILLDITVDAGFNRIMERNKSFGKELDRMERAGKEFHEKVRNGYLEIAKLNPHRVKIIDSLQDIDSVSNNIWDSVKKKLAQQTE